MSVNFYDYIYGDKGSRVNFKLYTRVVSTKGPLDSLVLINIGTPSELLMLYNPIRRRHSEMTALCMPRKVLVKHEYNVAGKYYLPFPFLTVSLYHDINQFTKHESNAN